MPSRKYLPFRKWLARRRARRGARIIWWHDLSPTRQKRLVLARDRALDRLERRVFPFDALFDGKLVLVMGTSRKPLARGQVSFAQLDGRSFSTAPNASGLTDLRGRPLVPVLPSIDPRRLKGLFAGSATSIDPRRLKGLFAGSATIGETHAYENYIRRLITAGYRVPATVARAYAPDLQSKSKSKSKSRSKLKRSNP